VSIALTSRRDHQVIHQYIIQNCFILPVKNDTPGWIDPFGKNGIDISLSFIFTGDNLQMKYLGDQHYKSCQKNKTDNTAS
jgi:hypothetical protein